MSQSVKLSDGSYIDAGAVWDNTQGKTIEGFNADIGKLYYPGVKTFTATSNDVWVYDTANTLTLSKGVYLISLRAESNSTNYLDVGVFNNATKERLWFESHEYMPPAPVAGQLRGCQVMFQQSVVDSLSIVLGVYSIGNASPSISYEIGYIKLQ